MSICTKGKFCCGLKLSTSKTKTMAFNGTDPVRSQILINNNIIEHMNTFNCPGCTTAYKNGKGCYCQNIRISPDNGN
jgi:hypothetical protein